MKNIPYTTHPTPFHGVKALITSITTDYEHITTSITLTGYKQLYMIMRLKLKGNNKPLLIVCTGQFDFKVCDWCIRVSFQWVMMTGIERNERRRMIITWKIKMKLMNLKNHNENMILKFI